jgi:hypothetical protein
MEKRVAVRFILAIGLILFVSVHWGCAPRLDEQQVRTRLVEQLQLRNDQLRIRSITRDARPVASVDYGGAVANLRFRYQDGVWVIDAVERQGRWESPDQGLRGLARELTAKARALQVAEVMPRYARTLKLLTGWATLLTADCGAGLPLSQAALLNLHGTWHRTLFANRGGEFHNADLFLRDAWWKMLHVTFSVTRVDVQSSGYDARMDTPDDLRLTYTRSHLRPGVDVCMPHYTLPEFVAEALGRNDAPAAWNCEDLIAALKRSGQLELVADR